jgi:signal transduction histidine kinase
MINTDFDQGIGMINVVSQDIGRVVLNIVMNAFHAVSPPQPPKGGDIHSPVITISTKRISPPLGGWGGERGADDGIEIRITDNGPGIPQNILDKIFQPFFTTKPTGQGTGLGLSLSYDIMKAHGGKLSVETKEGEGTTFILHLPIA